MMRVSVGPWRAEWEGGRLADIYHAEAEGALDCFQVGAYDGQRGELTETITRAKLRGRLREWIRDYGDDYIRNALPYA